MRKSFFIGFLFCAFVLQGQSISKRRIQKQLTKKEAFQQAQVALYVAPLSAKKPIAQWNSNRYMTPASNTKLLTFLAAQQQFDSLPSLFYHQQGDSLIQFKSSGYPLLFHPFYPDQALEAFFQQPVRWVYWAPQEPPHPLGPGWSWDDYSYYFAAEKNSFPIFGNSLQATFQEGHLKTNTDAFEFIATQDSEAPKLKRNRFKNTFTYNPRAWKENDTLYRPFLTSDSLFATLLSQAIQKPIALKRPVKDTLLWQPLYTHHEKQLYQGLLQDSDNGIAEALLLMIAEQYNGQMETQTAIDSLLTQWAHWLPDPIAWVDGSGVSRYNMITPRTLGAVLQKIHQRVGWKAIQTLFPKGGFSGTLKNYPVPDLYAKTGTLRHNHNLSGYLLNKHGEPFVFVVMINHYTAPTAEVKQGITDLLLWIQQKLK